MGNYLAFFPSYAYLRQVYEDFTARYPDIGTLAQESGLNDAARAAFLEQFGPSPAKTLLGFGVMGGIFGEGVIWWATGSSGAPSWGRSASGEPPAGDPAPLL